MSGRLAVSMIILSFDVAKLPGLDSDETAWADAILAALRSGEESKLPAGVTKVNGSKKKDRVHVSGFEIGY